MRNATASVVGRRWSPRPDGRRECENRYENRVLTVCPFTVIILSQYVYIRYVYRGNWTAAPARRNLPYAHRVCRRFSFVSSPSLFFRRLHPPLLFSVLFSTDWTRLPVPGPAVWKPDHRSSNMAREPVLVHVYDMVSVLVLC